MMTKKLGEGFLRYVIYGILFLLLLAAFINIQYGIDNLLVMSVFSSDEPYAVGLLAMNLEEGKLNPQGFYNYGYFYHTLTFYICQGLEQFDYTIDERFIAYTFRFISLLSYIGLILLSYKLTKHITCNEMLSLCASFFLASLPHLYYRAQNIHPDLLQTFLMMAAAYVALRWHRFSSAFWASFLAGVAFGTKYSGIFILPFLPIPALLAFWHNISQHHQRPRRKILSVFLGVYLGAFLLFLTGWCLTNPTILSNFQEVIQDILFGKQQLALGTGWKESPHFWLWFPVLHDEFKLGSILLLSGLLMLLANAVMRKKEWRSFIQHAVPRTIFTLVLYTGISSVYALVAINSRQPRYIFHIFPFLIVLCITGISRLISCETFKQKWRLVIIAGMIVCITPLSLSAVKSMAWCSQKYQHQYIRATQWIEAHYSPHTTILADAYSYQSPRFTRYQRVWGVDENSLVYFQPTLVIINKTLSGRWSWKREATKFADLDFVLGKYVDRREEIQAFHLKLFSEASPYGIVYEDTDIVILEGGPSK